MYKNYGDENFFEYGRLVQKESDTEFRIIVCDPYSDQEDKYQFTKAVVDITDSWINKEQVMEYGGMTEENFDPIQFALDCINYYGAQNFGVVFDVSKETIVENLNEYLSDDDISDRSCYIEEELARKRDKRGSEHYAKSSAACKVDMWYGNSIGEVDRLDITFNDLDGKYRGNCLIKGKYVGDFVAKDAKSIEKKFSHLQFNWDAQTEPMDICLTDTMKDML